MTHIEKAFDHMVAIDMLSFFDPPLQAFLKAGLWKATWSQLHEVLCATELTAFFSTCDKMGGGGLRSHTALSKRIFLAIHARERKSCQAIGTVGRSLLKRSQMM